MRGFKDHRKLTMVGFRFDVSQCSFDGHGTRSGGLREDCGNRTRELLSVLFSSWRQSHSTGGSEPGRDLGTDVSRLGFGDWQVSDPEG